MSDIMINFSGRNKIFSDSVRYQFKFLTKMNMEATELIKNNQPFKTSKEGHISKDQRKIS